MHLSSMRPVSSGPSHPAVSRTAELDTVEAFAVVSLRLWATPFRQPDRTYPDWRTGFMAAGAEEGERAFDELFRLVVASGQRTLDVRCARCPQLGGDEIAFLRMTAQLQRCSWFEAETILEDWLPRPMVNTALASAMIFATALSAAGLVLPQRAWPRPDLDALVAAADEGRVRFH